MADKKNKRKREVSTLSQHTTKDYFSKQFAKAFRKWQEDGGKNNRGRYNRTQVDFAQCANISVKSLEKYLQGKSFPSDSTFADILEEFKLIGIDRDFFIPDHDEFLPQYSPYDAKFQEGFNQWQARKHGLNFNFLRFLKKHPDFVSSFPFYNQEESEALKLENSIFQYEKDGKTYSLKLHDIETIIDIQKKAETYIKYLFFEMRGEVEKRRRIISMIQEENLNAYDTYSRLQYEGFSDYEIPDILREAGFSDYEIVKALRENGIEHFEGLKISTRSLND